jgi:hypothetical protein
VTLGDDLTHARFYICPERNVRDLADAGAVSSVLAAERDINAASEGKVGSVVTILDTSAVKVCHVFLIDHGRRL